MKWVVVLVLLIPAALACVVPRDGMMIGKSVDFCTDVYYLDKGILIEGKNLNLDCNGAVLKSWKGGRGISIEHSANVTITNCRVVNYNIGLHVRNSTEVYLEDNHLVKNKIGTRFVLVSDSATFNHDVSLSVPFEINQSEDNILSLTNKFVEGDFCSANFCNEKRSAIDSFVEPEMSAPVMESWLLDQLTGRNSIKKFYDYVFGGFENQVFGS